MGYTKDDWKAYLTGTQPDQWTICAGWDGEIGIAKTVYDDTVPDKDKAANAHLIAAAPAMYQALLDGWTMLAYWLVNFEDVEHITLCDNTREKIETIKKAIAQAEGREQDERD